MPGLGEGPGAIEGEGGLFVTVGAGCPQYDRTRSSHRYLRTGQECRAIPDEERRSTTDLLTATRSSAALSLGSESCIILHRSYSRLSRRVKRASIAGVSRHGCHSNEIGAGAQVVRDAGRDSRGSLRRRGQGRIDRRKDRSRHGYRSFSQPHRVSDRSQPRRSCYATGRGEAYTDSMGFAVRAGPLGSRIVFSRRLVLRRSVSSEQDAVCEWSANLRCRGRSENDYGPAAEREIAAKRADYFEAGTQVVWDVDPISEQILSYRAEVPETSPHLFSGPNSRRRAGGTRLANRGRARLRR